MRAKCPRCGVKKQGIRPTRIGEKGKLGSLACLKCRRGTKPKQYTELARCQGWCDKRKSHVHLHRASGLKLCRPCYRKLSSCAECGKKKPLHHNRISGHLLCRDCQRRHGPARRLERCDNCNKTTIIHRRINKKSLCKQCADQHRPLEKCQGCNRNTVIHQRRTRLCKRCYDRTHPAPKHRCRRCGKWAPWAHANWQWCKRCYNRFYNKNQRLTAA